MVEVVWFEQVGYRRPMRARPVKRQCRRRLHGRRWALPMTRYVSGRPQFTHAERREAFRKIENRTT